MHLGQILIRENTPPVSHVSETLIEMHAKLDTLQPLGSVTLLTSQNH